MKGHSAFLNYRKKQGRARERMPLPKYYCDYCDKQFQDTALARKRHLQGIQHQRARALWYDSLKAPNQIQAQSFGKGVCNRFLRTGFCQYGDSCKYYHPKQNIQNRNSHNMPVVDFPKTIQSSITIGNQFMGGSSFQGDAATDRMGVSMGNLPPSLRLLPEGGYPPLPFVDWG